MIAPFISNSAIIVTQNNKGLFGYRTVEDYYDPDTGDRFLSCSSPGLKRCRFHTAIAFDDGNGGTITLNVDEQDRLDEKISTLVNPENVSGVFSFESKVVVRYSYDINSDELKYEIMSFFEADQENLNY